MVSATPRRQEHELGALIAGVIAVASGWRVIYLGSNLPSEEIGAVVSNLNARVVALSIVYPNDDIHLKNELKNFKHLLPDGVSIIVGGKATSGYYDVLDELSVIVVKDSRHISVELEAILENKYN